MAFGKGEGVGKEKALQVAMQCSAHAYGSSKPKIISGDSESTALIRECFTDLVTDYFTHLSQSSVPFTLKSNLLPFHNSFVPRTTRDLRLSTV